MKNKSLWEYIIKDHDWSMPIMFTIGFSIVACATGDWAVFLVILGALWLISFIIAYFTAKELRHKDIERENREPKSCPDCGHKTKSEYCENCGKWLYAPETPNKCYNCGCECTTKFCGRCGAPH